MADLFESLDIKEEETEKSWVSHRKEVPKIFFGVLLLLYLAASVLVRIMSKTGGNMVKIGNGMLPMTAFAGVFTSIAFWSFFTNGWASTLLWSFCSCSSRAL